MTKTIRFTTEVDWILKDYAFTGLSSMAEVTTEVLEKGKRTTSKQYLIGSVKTLEELFISRSKHWSSTFDVRLSCEHPLEPHKM